MRIISGSLKGKTIKSPRGLRVRPTSDRVRESYFNIIGQYFDDVMVLDLFCGTGAIGFEFLSRGAKKVYFVDKSADSMAIVKSNAVLLNVVDRCSFYTISAENFLVKGCNDTFDYIYLDPPYKEIITHSILIQINESILNSDGILTLEHSIKVKYPDKVGDLYMFRQRRFGDTVLSFYSLDKTRFEEIL